MAPLRPRSAPKPFHIQFAGDVKEAGHCTQPSKSRHAVKHSLTFSGLFKFSGEVGHAEQSQADRLAISLKLRCHTEEHMVLAIYATLCLDELGRRLASIAKEAATIRLKLGMEGFERTCGHKFS